MDKKDLKQINDMFAKHIGILVEDFQHKPDIVVEGHQVLNEKIDRVQQDGTGLTTRVDRIELITLKLEKGQKKLEKGQEKLEKGQEKLEKGQKKLEQRQEKLEGEIKKVREDLSTKIDHVASEIAAHRADTESHSKAYRR